MYLGNLSNIIKKGNRMFTALLLVIMMASILAMPTLSVKAETKFSESELKKIYFAFWDDCGSFDYFTGIISETKFGDIEWKYKGLYDQYNNWLKFETSENDYYMGYADSGRCLRIYKLSKGITPQDPYIGDYPRYELYTRVGDDSARVSVYDIFEGEGIKLIGIDSKAEVPIEEKKPKTNEDNKQEKEDDRKDKKPDKVKGTKAVNKAGNKLYITWKAVTDADGYQIVYATDSKFTKSKKTVSVGADVYKKTISKLVKKKTYYVKVRAYKLDDAGKKVYGSYSTVSKINITK